ncbi:MAG: TolC family protein [Endomicrobium sp.]|jgi:outer membrane protein TolC|nr:TolC family protein [Endomicrobium sp.]
MKFLKLLLINTSVLTLISAVYCESLTISEYTDMVLRNNSELKSIQLNIESLKGKLAETEKVYSYSLNAGISYIEDHSGKPYNLINRPDKITNIKYEAGIDKQFATGTKIALGFNSSYSSTYMPDGLNNNFSDIEPFIGLQQSLLKDINGGCTKAGIEKIRTNAKSDLYKLEYKKQNILLNAKLIYWDLSYSRTVIDFKKLSLNRTKKILDWSQKKYNMDLIGKSDLLQSQIALKDKELSLQLAYEEEKKVNRSFNQFLNINDGQVKYEVEKFEDKKNNFKDNQTLSKKGARKDLLSALEYVQSAFYDQISAEKSLKADLVLKGHYALNGVERTANDAVKNIKDGSKPSYSLELRYILPLDFKLRKTINQGYESAKISAQKSAEYALIQENNDWLQLIDNWNNAKTRFNIIAAIEKIQQQRYEEDKNLFVKGRVTTTQVLRGEQALDDAELDVLKNILELIKIYEQAEVIYNNNDDIRQLYY